MTLKLERLPWSLAVHRLAAEDKIPAAIWKSPFHAVTRTDAELSLICESSIEIPGAKTERTWKRFRVARPRAVLKTRTPEFARLPPTFPPL